MKLTELRFNHCKHISALVLLVLCAGIVPAQTDKADDFIKAEMQRQNIPGLSLAVIKDGKVIKAEGYGLANTRVNMPATPETVYRIASFSKQFIAITAAADRVFAPSSPDLWIVD